MLENDIIRSLVVDGLLRKQYTVTEFIHKLRYEMKKDIEDAYISGYTEGYNKGKSEFGIPPNYNPNL